MTKTKEKNRERTEKLILETVDKIIEETGFESLGVNLIATKAGVSKTLIYRYFNSIDGLISQYILKNDFWINIEPNIVSYNNINQFIKDMFDGQINLIRENKTLRKLHRWELTCDNDHINRLRKLREDKGIMMIEDICNKANITKKEITAVASIISSAITYLAILSDSCNEYNGNNIQSNEGWENIREGIHKIIDLHINI